MNEFSQFSFWRDERKRKAFARTVRKATPWRARAARRVASRVKAVIKLFALHGNVAER